MAHASASIRPGLDRISQPAADRERWKGVVCDHLGPHTGESRYVRDAGRLRLVLICESCGMERAELGGFDYRPRARWFVGHLAELTARELGLSGSLIGRVRFAAMICDVGRDQIRPEILNKRGPLTPAEWMEVRRQPELGAALLSDTSFDDIRDWILSRRERMDGRGYPRGLRGQEIPLEARILAVCEAYVAMRSPRPHARMLDHAQAVAEVGRCAGAQFDPWVVEAFSRAVALREPPSAAAA